MILISCISVTLLTFLISTLVTQWSGVITLLGFVFLVISIALVVKYTMTELEYTIEGEDFFVTKIVGNKRTVVCSVNLETAIGLYKKEDYQHLQSNEKAIIKYVLNQNMKARSYVYLCEFNGKRAMIEFEPNETFVGIMNDAIENAKKHKDDFENGESEENGEDDM